jgi:four helix bundle protein
MEEMPKEPGGRPYDLEERTFLFAQEVRTFVKRLPRTAGNVEDSRQLIRASGSVGANYIEANESLGRKDFLMRIRTCRKEAKESAYWLRLLDCGDSKEAKADRGRLVTEARELMNIFAAILRKSQ